MNAVDRQNHLLYFKATGGFRNSRHAAREKAELKPELLTVKNSRCPADLSEAAKKEWRKLVPELIKLKVVSTLDIPALRRYCEYVTQWESCRLVIQSKGQTYTTASGQIKPRPEINIMFQSSREILNLAAQFGCTPAARARLAHNAITIPDDEEGDVLDELLRAAER